MSLLLCFPVEVKIKETAETEETKRKKLDMKMNMKIQIRTTLTDEQMKSIGIELGSIEQKQLTASLKNKWRAESAESK